MTDKRSDWVTFLSDYGLDDVFVGVCKGVIASIAPQAQILDVCHQVAPQDIRQGATVLATAIGYLPAAVHLALVDPPAARPTRGIAVETSNGSVLVGPDNGLLSLAWAHLGGAERAVELTNDTYWLDIQPTAFRGRDVYAPVVAHLASGVPFDEIGAAVATDSLQRLELRDAVVDDDHVHAEVRNVDHFGNLSLNVSRTDLEAAGIAIGDTVELRCGGRTLEVPFTLSVGETSAGRLVLSEDSFRSIMVALSFGSAGRTLRLGRGDAVVIARLQQPATTS